MPEQTALFDVDRRKPWADISLCGRYRYLLAYPTALSDERVCLWVLANPSTATAEETDPTVARCIAYSRRWGYGWAWVVNVRAWRETDPRKVPDDPLAVGPNNDFWIKWAALRAHLIVCGWGKLGGERGGDVLRLLREAYVRPHALKLNKDGSPQHPLYLRADLHPIPMEVP